MSAIVDIEPISLTKNGQRYRVWHGDEILVASTKDTLGSSARALVAKGVTGRLQTRWKGNSTVCMSGLIAVLATKTISENEAHGPRIARYVERELF